MFQFFALRADSLKNQVVSAEAESVRVPDTFAEIRDIVHIYVKDPAAFEAPRVIMVIQAMVKMVRAAR